MAVHLQQLSRDLEHNPSILVRVKYPSPPGSGREIMGIFKIHFILCILFFI